MPEVSRRSCRQMEVSFGKVAHEIEDKGCDVED